MAKIELPDPSAGVARRLRALMVKVERDAHADAAVRVLSAAVLVIAAGCAKLAMPSAAASFDPAPWLQDFAQVEHHLGVAYANLEWNYAHRGLKLDRLASETRLQIRGASSNRQAFRALASFIAAFRDPHLTVTPPGGLVRRVRYGLQLATDGSAIVVPHIDGAACDAAAGDVVPTIGGRPALETLDANLKLSRTSNRATALDWGGRQDHRLVVCTGVVARFHGHSPWPRGALSSAATARAIIRYPSGATGDLVEHAGRTSMCCARG